MRKMKLIKIVSVDHLLEMVERYEICYSNGRRFSKIQIANSRVSDLTDLIKNNRLYAEG